MVKFFSVEKFHIRYTIARQAPHPYSTSRHNLVLNRAKGQTYVYNLLHSITIRAILLLAKEIVSSVFKELFLKELFELVIMVLFLVLKNRLHKNKWMAYFKLSFLVNPLGASVALIQKPNQLTGFQMRATLALNGLNLLLLTQTLNLKDRKSFTPILFTISFTYFTFQIDQAKLSLPQISYFTNKAVSCFICIICTQYFLSKLGKDVQNYKAEIRTKCI